MVARYGMSDAVGPVAFGSDDGFGGERYSEVVGAKIDAEVTRILEDARKRAKKVLEEHRKALDSIAKKLVEAETIEREDFEKLLIANGITPKAKEEEGVVVAPGTVGGMSDPLA
jgi:ATP-dependent Zn protease